MNLGDTLFGGGNALSTLLLGPGHTLRAQYMKGSPLPAPPAPPLPLPGPPTIDEARRRREQDDMLNRRRGRAATILTAGQGFAPTTATATLLGE